MSTITWPDVRNAIRINPTKQKELSPFKMDNETVRGAQEVIDTDGFTRLDVSPATPLSAVLMLQDALYQATPEQPRRALLREETTRLQESAQVHLKGRQWPVRKTMEGISACGLEEGLPAKWTETGWNAVGSLRETQFIVINYEKKCVQFFPEEVQNWSKENDTIWVDHECKYIWTNQPTSTPQWLVKKELDEGWEIQWPLVDGTMVELKEMAAKLNESFSGKVTKDVLRKRIGRAQSISTLMKWTE